MRVTVRAGSNVASSAGNDPPNGRAIEPAESTCEGAPGEAGFVILDMVLLSWVFADDAAVSRLSRFRLVNQRIGFLRFAACADWQGVWHGGKVSGYGER